MDEFSPVYFEALDLTRKHHRNARYYFGDQIVSYRNELRRVIEKHRCKTMLDFGCGSSPRRWLAERLGVEIDYYDPGVPEFETLPTGPYDIVAACQVLGVIPEKDRVPVLRQMAARATKVVWIGFRDRRVKPSKIVEGHGVWWSEEDASRALSRVCRDAGLAFEMTVKREKRNPLIL